MSNNSYESQLNSNIRESISNADGILFPHFLGDLNSLCDKIIKNSHLSAKLYHDNNEEKARHCLSQVMEAIDIFVPTVNQIFFSDLIPPKTKNLLNNELKNLNIHLLSVLKAINNANEKKDFFMLCDLLEFELVDSLTQWKLKILLQIKTF